MKRLKSPVIWLSIIGLIYSVILAPRYSLPDWSQVAGFILAIFGIANNPTDHYNF